MEDDTTDLPGLIGRRVAERRAALGLNLDQVAERTGVSRAMVSRIERGEVHASAVVLDRLCSGLGLTLSALFARNEAAPVSRRADQPVWTDPESGYVRRAVSPGGSEAPFRIVHVDFPPGRTVTLGSSGAKPFVQEIWVLAGEMEIGLPTGRHRLAAGDCLACSPSRGISFFNPGPDWARYAVILTTESAP